MAVKKTARKTTKKTVTKTPATKKTAKKTTGKRTAAVPTTAQTTTIQTTTTSPAQQHQKSRIAAGIFAIILGGLGIHKFYLGKIWWGILYLIFFWAVIPWIVGIIEGILYLTATDEEFYEKYA